MFLIFYNISLVGLARNTYYKGYEAKNMIVDLTRERTATVDRVLAFLLAP